MRRIKSLRNIRMKPNEIENKSKTNKQQVSAANGKGGRGYNFTFLSLVGCTAADCIAFQLFVFALPLFSFSSSCSKIELESIDVLIAEACTMCELQLCWELLLQLLLLLLGTVTDRRKPITVVRVRRGQEVFSLPKYSANAKCN